MYKTYLAELLLKLSSKQMKELDEFVQSPFFNKNQGVIKLFEYLRLRHPDFTEENISKELIHRKVFHTTEYNDSFMRMLISKLSSLAEQYLAYSGFKQSGNTENIHLIKSLLDLNIDNEAGKQINRLEKSLKESKLLSGSHYKSRYELEKLKTIIYSRSYRPVTVKDKPDKALLEESNCLTAYFLITALQRYRYLLNKSFTVNTDFDLEFLPYIMKFLEGEGSHYLEIPLVLLLYKQILVLKDNSREDLVEELIASLTDDNLAVSGGERRDGLIVMVNICIEKGYEGKQKFYHYIFSINKYLVSKNLYNRVKGGYFDNEMFINIVTIGLKLNETGWIKKFVEDNYKKLAPDMQMNSYNYCYAKLYFKTGDFEKAYDSIAKISYSDLHMKINVRITTITILYELNNIEEALTQIDNFKKYIQNDKLLAPGHKRISSSFIKYTAALCKARYSNRPNLEELKKNILSADQISNRAWLLNKTEELIKFRK